jgi:hypothetical protein
MASMVSSKKYKKMKKIFVGLGAQPIAHADRLTPAA